MVDDDGVGSRKGVSVADDEDRCKGGSVRVQDEDVVVGGADGEGYFGTVACTEVRVVVVEDRRAEAAPGPRHAPLFDGENKLEMDSVMAMGRAIVGPVAELP